MSGKRRGPKLRPRGPFASSLPKIRDELVGQLVAEADGASEIPAEVAVAALMRVGAPRRVAAAMAASGPHRAAAWQENRLEAAALAGRDAQLWWVTRRMAILAAEAAGTIPEWTPTAARPSRAGVVWWEGGAGFEAGVHVTGLDAHLIAARTAVVMGCTWWTRDDGSLTLAPIVVEPGSTAPFGVKLGTVARTTWTFEHDQATVGFTTGLWPMLGATWLLALSPTVGVVHGVRYDRWDPDRPFARPAMPGLITVVTLREWERGAPQINGLPRHGLDHQVLVRGHWRQQPCGPKRAWRKPVFIAPHVRGPEGTELVTKPTVHVWRR